MTERFSASQAGRHMACHASANLDLAIPNWKPPVEDPNRDSAANRGTNMHAILAEVMELSTHDVTNMAKALTYVAELRATRRFKVLTEVSVTAQWLATDPDTTVDLVLYVQDEIHVLDWKTGRVRVEVNDNEQLLYYAACFAHLAPKASGVWVHIVQPWADNIEKAWVSTSQLRTFMAEARKAEAAIQAGDITFGPSDHCMFCPANPHSRGEKGMPLCPAMMQILYPAQCDELEILGI